MASKLLRTQKREHGCFECGQGWNQRSKGNPKGSIDPCSNPVHTPRSQFRKDLFSVRRSECC